MIRFGILLITFKLQQIMLGQGYISLKYSYLTTNETKKKPFQLEGLLYVPLS